MPKSRFLTAVLLVAGAALALSACMVGPHYTAPVEAPVTLSTAGAAVVSTAPSDGGWWRSFGDPVLDDLTARGLANNNDVKVAVARIHQSRALFTDAKLDLFPRITAFGSYTRSDEQVPGFGTNRVNVESADLGFDARWEIDLFGRVRHGVDAARDESQARTEDLRDVRITVIAEIARNYLTLRGLQAQRVVAEHNAETSRRTLDLTILRRDAGRGDPVDVESARARLNATEARIPALDSAAVQTINRLAVLVGVRPGALDASLTPLSTPRPPRATPLAIGDAANFLRRRPDVQAAERRLAAQTARTGEATADLFPRINVTGFLGLLSGNVSSLFATGAQAYAVTPAVSWPALDLGGARARLRAQAALGDVAHAQYDLAVLNAIEDLQNALVAYRDRQLELTSLAAAAGAAERASGFAHARYEQGSIDFLRVLDTERTALDAQDALIQAQTAANTDVVAVYNAIGGE
ncbi:MAG: efflux system, outer rane lipoprotein NodT family [Caulobacteraceae bacterium]|nr:efflux system, outer rane lipoprotein NodT family [Caulobacteraceae bacterium]